MPNNAEGLGFSPILRQEEIPIGDVPKGTIKGNDLVNASLYLFGHLLSEGDTRWDIVDAYVKLQARVKFRPQHMENAQRAIYLSRRQSYRNRYTSYGNDMNVRHLCRAIVNIGAYEWLEELFGNVVDLGSGLTIKFERTKKILMGSDERGVTGCPEALYQLQCNRSGDYIGRIGFNVHTERGQHIFSVSNVQGIPDGEQAYMEIAAEFGTQPLNLLLRRLQEGAETMDEPVQLRGLRNPPHGQNPALYNKLFVMENVSRYWLRKGRNWGEYNMPMDLPERSV